MNAVSRNNNNYLDKREWIQFITSTTKMSQKDKSKPSRDQASGLGFLPDYSDVDRGVAANNAAAAGAPLDTMMQNSLESGAMLHEKSLMEGRRTSE